MEAVESLGPFSGLSTYREENLLIDLPTRESIEVPYRFGRDGCFDFDVRPQRTCLTNGRHLRLTQQGADWEEILDRCIQSVARTLRLSGKGFERGVEGEDGHGSVTCWVRARPNKAVLTTAMDGLMQRIGRQDWPKFHPEWCCPLEAEQIQPGRDRIGILILDPKTGHTVPMLAENFYFVNHTPAGLDSFPLRDWPALLARKSGA